MRGIIRWFRGCRETCSECRSGINGNLCGTSYWSSHRRAESQGNLMRDETQIRATSWRPEIIQIVLRRWFEECWKRTLLHYTGWRRTRRNEESMSRVYIASKWRSIVDSRKHENRPSLGCEHLSSSRTLWYWNHDRISVSRQNSFLGSIFERNNKYVTETSETIALENVEHKEVTETLVAKANPQVKPLVPVSVPFRERKRIDTDTQPFDQSCFALSKVMIRLLRHGASVPREDDGAVRFDGLVKEFEAKFDDSSQWSVNDWVTYMAKGGGQKKRFQYCLNPHFSKLFLCFRAIHDIQEMISLILHWGLHRLHLPRRKCEWNVFNNHKWIHSRRKNLKGKRQSVFFTAVNPMDDDRSVEEIRCNMDKPRLVPYKSTWRFHQNTVYWCKFQRAQKRGLQFHQTGSHAIVLCNTQLSICVKKRCAWKPTSYSAETEFAKLTTGQTWSRKSKNILRPPKRIGNLWRNPRQQHRLQNTRHTSFYSQQQDTNRRENSQKVDTAVWESPEQGVFPAGLEQDRSD